MQPIDGLHQSIHPLIGQPLLWRSQSLFAPEASDRSDFDLMPRQLSVIPPAEIRVPVINRQHQHQVLQESLQIRNYQFVKAQTASAQHPTDCGAFEPQAVEKRSAPLVPAR